MSAGGVQQGREERGERRRAGDGAGIGGISAHRLGSERAAVALRRARDFHFDHVPVEQAAGMQTSVSCQLTEEDRSFSIPFYLGSAMMRP